MVQFFPRASREKRVLYALHCELRTSRGSNLDAARAFAVGFRRRPQMATWTLPARSQ